MTLQQDNTRIRTEIQTLKDANKDLKVCQGYNVVCILEPCLLTTYVIRFLPRKMAFALF